ncbi:uncharacterized protein LOC123011778 [Tribolium madens]|uniref:uncharacterized protein LOC123011778 n=1 Tax=Tribolium madens TaxID=41895 RepID=UPI001CF73951|nr:uncharacterized protein LOC123011778 [Tribolium madens]
MWNTQFIILFALPVKVFSQNLTCSKVDGILNEVIWPGTNTSTLSQPLCVDENKELLHRRCVNGEWEPEPKCFYVQVESFPRCPEGYIEKDDICYTFLETTFPPKCPSANILFFYEYIHQVQNATNVWMPITRDLSSGFGVMQWVEPSWKYKKTYSHYSMIEIGSDKNCIIFNGTSNIAVSCNEKHQAICAYGQRQLIESGCSIIGRCVTIDFFDASKCVCTSIKDNSEEKFLKKAEILSPVQNYIYPSLVGNDSCNIGLEKLNNTYLWSNSNREITYTWWSQKAVFYDNLKYGAITKDGWILTDHSFDCSLCEVEIEETEPNLLLNYSNISNQFILEIISSERFFVVFCFTNADSETLNYPYEIQYFDTISHFEPFLEVPGHYWCEMFSLDYTTVFKSNVYFYEPHMEYYEFTSTWKIFYSEIIDPVLETVKYINEILSKMFTSNTLYTPRIMKTYNLNTTENTLLVKIHITSRNVNNTEEFEANNIEAEIKSTLSSEKKANFVNLLSAKSCFKQVDNNLTWPKTPIDDATTSEEFCFTTNATRVLRTCSGDFISGAQWTSYEYCEQLNYSSVTNQLLSLYEKDHLDEESYNTINEISKNYQKLGVLDVFLIGEMYSNSDLSEQVFETFLKTLNNLLNVVDVLIESQMKTKATRRFLDLINRRSTVSSLNITTRNLALYSLKSLNTTTVSVLGSEVKIGIPEKINFDSTIDLQNIPEDSNISIALFFKDQFFCDFTKSYNIITPVYSMFASSEFDKPVRVFYRINKPIVNETCLRWNSHGNNNFGNWEESKAEKNNYLLMCEFQGNGVYAANYEFGPINVSNEPLDILDSNDSNYEYGPKNVSNKPLNILEPNNSNFEYGPKNVSNEPLDILESNDSNYEYGPKNVSNKPLDILVFNDSNYEYVPKNMSNELLNILESDETPAVKIELVANISKHYEQFKPIDVFHASEILENAANDDEINLQSLAELVSNTNKINQTVLFDSQTRFQATDKILLSIDSIIQNYKGEIELIQTEKFAMMKVNLQARDFQGAVLYQEKGKIKVDLLQSKKSIDYRQSNFDSALFLSDELRQQLGPEAEIILTVFSNDALFIEKESNRSTINAILGIILPEIGEYEGPVSIIHKVEENSPEDRCVFWKFGTSTTSSYWKKDPEGNCLSNSVQDFPSNFIQCDYYHTTHFAFLFVPSSDFDYNHASPLKLITTLTNTLSGLSLLCIVLTAIVFKKWRNDTGNKLLLNFVFVLIFQTIFFYISSSVSHSQDFLCTIIGAFLHYFTICEFCWMFFIASLQYRRFVTVLEAPPRYPFLKGCLCGWGLPLIPVSLVLFYDINSYTLDSTGLCYPSGWSLYLAVWIPVFVIIITNFCIFLIILHKVFYRKVKKTGKSNVTRHELRLAILLFFLFGLTWIFGVLHQLKKNIVLLYLFTITGTLHGFVIFLFFIVLNPRTRNLKLKCFR